MSSTGSLVCLKASLVTLTLVWASVAAAQTTTATGTSVRTQTAYQRVDERYRGGYTTEDPPPESERSVEKTEEEKDDGPELFWLMPAPGFQTVNMTTFYASNDESLTADLAPTVASGPALSLGLGLRFLVLTLGARGGVAFLSDSGDRPVRDLRLWSINGELGFRFIPNSKLEPYLLLGGGYSVFTGFDDAAELGGRFQVRGPNARVGLGLDFFANETVSIGALAMGELLFLTRPGVSAQDLLTPQRVETVGEARARVLQADGTSVGTAFAIVAGPGFHFD